MLVRLAAAAVVVLLCSCASVVDGSGTGRPAGTPPAPTSTSTSTSAGTSAGGTSEAPSPSLSAPPTGPTPLPAPAACAGGRCTQHASADLGDGYAAVLWAAQGQGGSGGSTVLELTSEDVPVFWRVTADQLAGDMVCSPRPVPNCVVTMGAGAHASVAEGYVRRADALVRVGEVPSDTPSTDPLDLDGDGLIDVVTAINTYEPTYATGTVYWQTFRSTGRGFASSGCTAPDHNLPAEPTTLLTGSCPA